MKAFIIHYTMKVTEDVKALQDATYRSSARPRRAEFVGKLEICLLLSGDKLSFSDNLMWKVKFFICQVEMSSRQVKIRGTRPVWRVVQNSYVQPCIVCFFSWRLFSNPVAWVGIPAAHWMWPEETVWPDGAVWLCALSSVCFGKLTTLVVKLVWLINWQ